MKLAFESFNLYLEYHVANLTATGLRVEGLRSLVVLYLFVVEVIFCFRCCSIFDDYDYINLLLFAFLLQRFAAVIMRIREPKTTALIFASGKMVSSTLLW